MSEVAELKQVSSDHYSFGDYVKLHRWISYYTQLQLLLEQQPHSVLEIGPGISITRQSLMTFIPDVDYKTVDVAEDLHPDILGSIDSLPVADSAYDVVCAFEVLEHLPYEKFIPSLLEMSRVAKKAVIISVPHAGPWIRAELSLSFLFQFRKLFKFQSGKEHQFDGEHYWEVGKKGFSPNKIRGDIRKHFILKKEFVQFQNHVHRFYVLERK